MRRLLRGQALRRPRRILHYHFLRPLGVRCLWRRALQWSTRARLLADPRLRCLRRRPVLPVTVRFSRRPRPRPQLRCPRRRLRLYPPHFTALHSLSERCPRRRPQQQYAQRGSAMARPLWECKAPRIMARPLWERKVPNMQMQKVCGTMMARPLWERKVPRVMARPLGERKVSNTQTQMQLTLRLHPVVIRGFTIHMPLEVRIEDNLSI